MRYAAAELDATPAWAQALLPAALRVVPRDGLEELALPRALLPVVVEVPDERLQVLPLDEPAEPVLPRVSPPAAAEVPDGQLPALLPALLPVVPQVWIPASLQA